MEQLHSLPPMPRPLMACIVLASYLLDKLPRWVDGINHTEVTQYLSNGAAICAITHYTVVFVKWNIKRIKDKRSTT